jgi:L-threonylcarbamoyladenylate synthase
MELFRIDAEDPDRDALVAAAEAVLRGGVIAFPTDTVYGLGCSLFDVSAVEMIERLKRRNKALAVISLIPEPAQAWGLAADISSEAERLMTAHWPGPLSLIFKAAPIVPPRVRGAGSTVALRCPKHVLCERLLDFIGGPVVSSSANLSVSPPAESAEQIVSIFGNQIDVVLDGGPVRGAKPSTLVDVTGPQAKLLRPGAIDLSGELGENAQRRPPASG